MIHMNREYGEMSERFKEAVLKGNAGSLSGLPIILDPMPIFRLGTIFGSSFLSKSHSDEPRIRICADSPLLQVIK